MPDVRPVLLAPTPDDLAAEAAHAVRDLDRGDPAAVLRWASDLGPRVPHPAGGATVRRWQLLASVGAQDLAVARMLEPHLDALAILAEARHDPPPGTTWGVWAAEGPGARLEAHGDDATGWVLTGRKPWCSLAATVSHGLVTAWVDEHARRLFAIDLADPGVQVEDGTWAPAGLADVVTTPVSMAAVAGRPVGALGWYLDRDGFWWGGIGVAAVWYGGAVGVARRLARQVRDREPDQLALMHLGEVDAALAGARAILAEAGTAMDAGTVTGAGAILLGARVRHVVATAAEVVLRHVAHATGPGPLSQEPEHVARVADLALYVRQHHGERDAAGLGSLLRGQHPEQAPW